MFTVIFRKVHAPRFSENASTQNFLHWLVSVLFILILKANVWM